MKPTVAQFGVLAAAVAAQLLLAGCAGTRDVAAPPSPTRPVATVTPVSSAAAGPTSPATPAIEPRGRATLSLLPPPCRDSQLRISPHWQGDGATGTSIMSTVLRLVAGPPCVVRGFPRVRLSGADGTPLPLVYERSTVPARIVIVRREHPAQLTIAKYRCDIAPSRRRTDHARIVLPGLRAQRVLPTLGWLPLCAPRDPSHTVEVWPLRGEGLASGAPYAVSMRGMASPGSHPTWCRADLDDDGDGDVVVVQHTSVVARVNGHVFRTPMRRDPTAHLQGISDLDADGRAEILVATSSTGCCGYRAINTRTRVFHLASNLVQVGRLDFDSGAGDRFAGLRCGTGTFEHVSISSPDGDRWRRTVSTMRVRQDRIVIGSVELSWLRGGVNSARTASETRCPGLGVDG